MRPHTLRFQHRVIVVAVVIAAAFVQASARTQKPPAKPDQSTTPIQTVWPLPPDEPRLKYVGIFATNDDVGATKTTKAFSWKEKLLGKETVASERAPIRSFVKPFGVALDGFGRIIVTDPARAAVVVMDPANRLFTPIGEARRQAHFRIPTGLAVDAANNIYVGDNGLKQILVFGPDLAFRFAIQGDLDAPSGLALDDARNRLYVADTRKHALFVHDAATGKRIGQLMKRGEGDGEFNFPTGVAVGPGGDVYVTDTLNQRIEVFTPGLKFRRAFGGPGDQPGQFRRPKGIAIDADGVVYVVDADYGNVQMFTPEGQVLMFFGAPGRRPGHMILPAGIAIDRASRRIYVCEQENRRVQVFERVGRPYGK